MVTVHGYFKFYPQILTDYHRLFLFFITIYGCVFIFESEFKIPLHWRGGGAADGVVEPPKNSSPER
jgi:hypothetical protein